MAKKKLRTSKVFCIGFHKTGTSSLGLALEQLGYNVCGHFVVPPPLEPSEVKEQAFKLADRHDAVQDSPWFMLYEELDARYPGSKFILTVRPTDEWVHSIVRHFGSDTTARRKWIYSIGHPEGNENVYARRYERHNREVRAYFENRKEDFLELHLTNGEDWETLCPFLSHPIPNRPFPHAQKATKRERGKATQWIYKSSPQWLQKVESAFWKAIRPS